MSSEKLLRDLYQRVAAGPPDPADKPPLRSETLSLIQHLHRADGLKRPQENRLASLLRSARNADELNLRLIRLLPGSNRLVKALAACGAGAKLAAAQIEKDSQIWNRLADNHAGELNALAATLGLPAPRFLEAITDSSLDAATEYEPGWLRRHASDLVICIVIGLALTMLGGMVLRGLPPLRAEQVVLTRDIQPFEPIGARDVTLQTVGRKAGAFSNTADVIGKYSIAGLTRNSVPTSADLSAKALAGPSANRSIIRVPLNIGKSDLPWLLPATVTLMLAPRHTSTSAMLVTDCWVLALGGDGTAKVAWVAVDSGKLSQMANSLGDSDVFLVHP